MNEITIQFGDANSAWMNVWAALLGAVIGALASGVASYLLAERTDRAAEKSAAYLLLVRLSSLVSSLLAIERQLKEQVSRAEQSTAGSRPWERMVPLVSASTDRIFSPDDVSVFFRMKQFDLANHVLLLDEKHLTLTSSLTLYAEKRAAFAARFGASMNGRIGTTILSEDEAKFAGPLSVELNDLAKNIWEMSETYAAEGRELFTQVAKVLRDHFKKGFPAATLIETDDLERPQGSID